MNRSHLIVGEDRAHDEHVRNWLSHWGVREEVALLALLMALGSLFVVILTYVGGHVG